MHTAVDAHHCNLDDVGCGSLNRCVDGVALSKTAHGGVVGIDVGEIATPTEKRFGVAFLSCHFDGFLHVFLHLWVGGKVFVDEFLCFCSAHLHPFCESESGDAVDDAEIGGFCLSTLVGSDFLDRQFIHLGSRGAMDVVTFHEGFNHVGVAAQMCHDSKFDLRVVGREKLASWLWNECLAHFLSVLVADRDVLQIGIRRGEATCCRNSLIIRRVDMSCPWVNQFGKAVDVGGKKLLVATVIKDFLHDRMSASEVLEHVFGSDVLPRFCLLCLLHDFEFSEENFTHLSRR